MPITIIDVQPQGNDIKDASVSKTRSYPCGIQVRQRRCASPNVLLDLTEEQQERLQQRCQTPYIQEEGSDDDYPTTNAMKGRTVSTLVSLPKGQSSKTVHLQGSSTRIVPGKICGGQKNLRMKVLQGNWVSAT